jgi:hypothetical protein
MILEPKSSVDPLKEIRNSEKKCSVSTHASNEKTGQNSLQ